MPVSAGSSPRTRISVTFSQPADFSSGRPSRIVAIAFAWISGPGISSSPKETGWTSCSEGAHGPTTTILPLKRPGSNCPRDTFENGTDGIVPTGPW